MGDRVWEDLPVEIHEGAGVDGADRITFTRADGSVAEILPTLAWQPADVEAVSRWIGVASSEVLDFTVVRLATPGVAAAVFTQSRCPSDAVLFDRANIEGGEIQLLCVISKNANAFTPTGAADIRSIAEALSAELDVPVSRMLISCTGIIGVPLPMERILAGVRGVRAQLRPGALEESARAILTTDHGPKMGSVRVGASGLCGFVKGAGMIEPHMATMLGYLFTDARIPQPELDAMLRRVVERTFNAISVDSDTSTSDTVAIFSTGAVELSAAEREELEHAVFALALKLAREIVSQSEGADKTIEVDVSVSTSAADARALGKALINSPLVKTAIHGADPNWGRVVMAIGKPAVSVSFDRVDPADLRVHVMGTCVFDRGAALRVDLKELSGRMRAARNVKLGVELGEPRHRFKGFGCALTQEYVVLNSEYTT